MTKTMPTSSTSRFAKYLSTFPPVRLLEHYSRSPAPQDHPAVPRWRVTASDYRGLVKRIVIAGGIGAGKSVVGDRLRSLGFTVVDADDVAHDVTKPGSPTLSALVDAFGSAVLDEKGSLDRAFVAEVVFHDPSALRRLNAITHGPIGVEIQ